MDISNIKVTEERNTQEPVKVRGGSMAAKIGLCALAAVLALVIRIAERRRTAEEQTVTASASQDTPAETDALGTLHFVDAGDLSVLGPDKWTAPVTASAVELLDDERMLGLTAAAGEVKNCCLGEVRQVAEDAQLGLYVRIAHGSDLETCYFGLTKALVEPGQVVQAGDTLGTVAAGGTLCMTVRKAGAPQNPVSYVDVRIGS